MNKKAVSPLVATIILLAFAVALGSVVMTWGKGLIEKAANPESAQITVDQGLTILQKCVNGNSITMDEYEQMTTIICPS